jgi:hypothetical protein
MIMQNNNSIKQFKTNSKALFDMFTYGFNFTNNQIDTLHKFYSGEFSDVSIKYVIEPNTEVIKVVEIEVYGFVKRDC